MRRNLRDWARELSVKGCHTKGFADLRLIAGSCPQMIFPLRALNSVLDPSRLARISSQGAGWIYPVIARIDRAPPAIEQYD